jgi:hypothetical protein
MANSPLGSLLPLPSFGIEISQRFFAGSQSAVCAVAPSQP